MEEAHQDAIQRALEMAFTESSDLALSTQNDGMLFGMVQASLAQCYEQVDNMCAMVTVGADCLPGGQNTQIVPGDSSSLRPIALAHDAFWIPLQLEIMVWCQL